MSLLGKNGHGTQFRIVRKTQVFSFSISALTWTQKATKNPSVMICVSYHQIQQRISKLWLFLTLKCVKNFINFNILSAQLQIFNKNWNFWCLNLLPTWKDFFFLFNECVLTWNAKDLRISYTAAIYTHAQLLLPWQRK